MAGEALKVINEMRSAIVADINREFPLKTFGESPAFGMGYNAGWNAACADLLVKCAEIRDAITPQPTITGQPAEIVLHFAEPDHGILTDQDVCPC